MGLRQASTGLPLGLGVAVAVLIVDQLAKRAVVEMLDPYQPLALLPVLNLTLAFNPGAAFSLLADGGGWQRWALAAVALAVSAYLVHWLKTLPAVDRLQAIGLGGILGGALGNMVDRLWLGAVIDFIDLHVAGWHWPAFNVADSAITVGVGAVVVCVLRDHRRERRAKP